MDAQRIPSLTEKPWTINDRTQFSSGTQSLNDSCMIQAYTGNIKQIYLVRKKKKKEKRKEKKKSGLVVVHAFSPSTQETDTGRSL